ncbi:MAG TPA: FtsW/RodA/SpoVE family cell cycle protein, partial [Acidimicrobiales bacterium]|nr:FtsW/RodA/SpoVE family cell cycle protein [Acidimicrobiales bacterium]
MTKAATKPKAKAKKSAAATKRSATPAAAADPGRTTFLLLAVVVAALLVIGLVMVLSASSVQALKELGSTWSYFIRHATWLVLGTAAMVITAAVPYRRWRKLSFPLLMVSGVLL